MGPHVPGQWCRVGSYCLSCTDSDTILIVVPKAGSLPGMQSQHTQGRGILFNCGSVQKKELGDIPQKKYLFIIPTNFSCHDPTAGIFCQLHGLRWLTSMGWCVMMNTNECEEEH